MDGMDAYGGNSLWTLTVTVTLNTAKQICSRDSQAHSDAPSSSSTFGYRRFTGSKDIIWVCIYSNCDLSLWPWTRQLNLFTRRCDFIIMYKQPEFGCERISNSENMAETFLCRLGGPSRWPNDLDHENSNTATVWHKQEYPPPHWLYVCWSPFLCLPPPPPKPPPPFSPPTHHSLPLSPPLSPIACVSASVCFSLFLYPPPPPSLAKAATIIIFVATKQIFCRNKSMLAMTKLLLQQNYVCHDFFLAVTNICRNKRVYRDKSKLVVTKLFLWQNYV